MLDHIPGCNSIFSPSQAAIVGDIDHTKTNINDNVKIVQFNYSGSFPSIAKIIGIHKFNWDMTKPIGKRKLNEIRLGTYEN